MKANASKGRGWLRHGTDFLQGANSLGPELSANAESWRTERKAPESESILPTFEPRSQHQTTPAGPQRRLLVLRAHPATAICSIQLRVEELPQLHVLETALPRRDRRNGRRSFLQRTEKRYSAGTAHLRGRSSRHIL